MPLQGGQTARSYSIVAVQDVQGAAASLKAELEPIVQAALRTQVQLDETLLLPLSCSEQVTPDQAIGTEAIQLHVSVEETCAAEVYTMHAEQMLLRQRAIQTAKQKLGAGYTLQGAIQATATIVTSHGQGRYDLTVTVTGQWGYQFSQAQVHHLTALLAGRSETEAHALLLRQSGVERVSFSFTHSTTLPTNRAAIHVVLLEAAR